MTYAGNTFVAQTETEKNRKPKLQSLALITQKPDTPEIMKTKSFLTILLAFVAIITGYMPVQSQAALIGTADYNDSITAIFGTGNPPGSWTSATSDDTVAALRGRQRFTTNMNNDGAGTYQFALNTDVNIDFSLDSGAALLSNYTYALGIDINPAFGAQQYVPYTFDPVLVFSDNSYGNSGTGSGLGVEGNFLLAGTNSITQNSQRLALFGIDTSVPGEYTSFLSVYTKGNSPRLVGQSEINVVIGDRPSSRVPDSSGTLGLSGLALSGLMLARKKMKAGKN